jgi:hypothetical protein
MLVLYPNKELQQQLDQKTWNQAVQSWVKVLHLWLDQRDPAMVAEIVEFSNSYVHECVKTEDPVVGDSEQALRSAVFQTFLATADHPRNPQVTWEFVEIFGGSNVFKVCEYLIQGADVVPSLGIKLSRIILYSLKVENPSGHAVHMIVSGLSVILKPLMLRNQILNENWFKELQMLETSLATQVRIICEKSIGLPDFEQVKSVLDIFPQLTYSNVEGLLRQYGSPESLISALFDDSSLLDEAITDNKVSQSKSEPKIKTASTAKSDSRSHYRDDYKVSVLSRHQQDLVKDESTIQTTLRLIYQADEDERDDTYDDAEVHQAEDPSSSNLLNKIEHYLWDIYQKSPANFKRDSRKSKIRNEMRKKTEWSDEQIEGWARMLELSPRRRQVLEDRYMFKGNRPERGFFGHLKLLAGDNEIDTGLSSGVDSGQNSDDEAGTASSSVRVEETNDDKKSERAVEGKTHNTVPSAGPTSRQGQRHKTANKAKQGNHNRKAGHAKKMNKGMAGVE